MTPVLHGLAIVAVFVLLVILNFMPTGLANAVAGALLWMLLLIGISQFLYMGPLIYLARRKGRVHVAQGLIIGAAVTFALNGACWALLNPEGIQDVLNGRSPRLF